MVWFRKKNSQVGPTCSHAADSQGHKDAVSEALAEIEQAKKLLHNELTNEKPKVERTIKQSELIAKRMDEEYRKNGFSEGFRKSILNSPV